MPDCRWSILRFARNIPAAIIVSMLVALIRLDLPRIQRLYREERKLCPSSWDDDTQSTPRDLDIEEHSPLTTLYPRNAHTGAHVAGFVYVLGMFTSRRMTV